MRARDFTVIILTVLLLLACSMNAKKKKEAPVVVVEKTKIELAVESADAAKQAYENNDYEAAIADYNKAIDFYNQSLPTAAETDSIPKQIYRLKLNVAKIYNDYAYKLSQENNFDGAVTNYEASLNAYKNIQAEATPQDLIDTKITDIYLNLAISNRKAGEFQKALDFYDLYLTAHPEDSDILLQKFDIYKNDLQNKTQAFEVLKAYATSKNDFGASFKLGDLYSEDNDKDNAILWYEKALTIKNDPNVLKKLSGIYKAKSQFANSNRVLEQFIATNPGLEDLKLAYKLMGSNYKDLKNKPKAVEYFEKYLNLEYDEGIALYVCLYYYEIKNNARTLSFSNLILSKNPNNSNALLFRAIAKYNTKDMKGAKADFERIQNDPNNGKTAQQYLKIIK